MRKTLLFCLLLASCASAPVQATDASLQPYLTGTSIATSTPDIFTIIETPMPTGTLQIHVIQPGDTISEIAETYKITQADLIAANPDVNPSALPIGGTLFIPDPSAPLAAASTLTPLPVPVTQAVCHPTADSGLWCFALIQNNTTAILENVSAQITLLDENNNAIASETAFPLLDIIQPNSSLPVYVFFPHMPADAKPQVQLLSAMQGSGAGYLPAALDNTSTRIDWNGKIAFISGQVMLSAESNAATQVWVAAVAYDKDGTVVGLRRWEGGALQPGGSINFEFSVSSVGGEIEAVGFAIQAR